MTTKRWECSCGTEVFVGSVSVELTRVRIRYKPDRKNLELYFIDPLTGAERTKSAKTRDRGDAERAAERWETEIQEGATLRDMSWEIFRERFEDEHLAGKAKSTMQTTCGSLN